MPVSSIRAPSTRALLRRDCLSLDALPHWVGAPWFPEHWNDVVLPLQFGGRTLYLCTSGLMLFLPQNSPGKVLIDGRTGEFSSTLHIERSGTRYTLHGNLTEAPVKVEIQLAPGRIAVSGKAGQGRADYRIERVGESWLLAGRTGRFTSDFEMKEEDGAIRLVGNRYGDPIDARLCWENDSLRWKDGSDTNFVVHTPSPTTLSIEGQLRGQAMDMTLGAVGRELRLSGSTHIGKVNVQVSDEGTRLVVKGRLLKWFVNYQVEVT